MLFHSSERCAQCLEKTLITIIYKALRGIAGYTYGLRVAIVHTSPPTTALLLKALTAFLRNMVADPAETVYVIASKRFEGSLSEGKLGVPAKNVLWVENLPYVQLLGAAMRLAGEHSIATVIDSLTSDALASLIVQSSLLGNLAVGRRCSASMVEYESVALRDVDEAYTPQNLRYANKKAVKTRAPHPTLVRLLAPIGGRAIAFLASGRAGEEAEPTSKCLQVTHEHEHSDPATADPLLHEIATMVGAPEVLVSLCGKIRFASERVCAVCGAEQNADECICSRLVLPAV